MYLQYAYRRSRCQRTRDLFMNVKIDYGFTLIEILVAVTILAILASIAVYNVNSGDKISEAETIVLKQALISYIPEQLKAHYLRGDRMVWKSRVSQIQNEMADWPHLQGSLRTATVYKNDGIELKFRTSYQDREQNEQLRSMLIKSPLIEAVAIAGYRKQQFTVKYKLN